MSGTLVTPENPLSGVPGFWLNLSTARDLRAGFVCLQAMSLPSVVLKPGEADRLVAGHSWVYANSILRITAPPEEGDLVQVKDHRQRLLGTGFYNSRSKIAVRLLDRERIEPDRAFFKQRIAAALAHRQRWMSGATSYRVVNSESDFLSGLIVDRYEDVLVVQISSLGMDRRKALIVEVLQELLSPRAILERSDTASRKFEGLADSQGVLAGEAVSRVDVRLNGLRFETDLAEGHKTGMYLDQQTNYAAVGELARNSNEVLDCFSFLGGFALHAARAGAGNVHALDQSAEAVAAATRNAAAANDYLNSRGIIVRPVGGYGLPDCLRITVGTEDQNRAVIDALSGDTVTLTHPPIPALKWPQMQMDFKLPPRVKQPRDLEAGDRLQIEFEMQDGDVPRITSLQRVAPEPRK